MVIVVSCWDVEGVKAVKEVAIVVSCWDVGEGVKAVKEVAIVVNCWDVEAPTWLTVVCDGVEVVVDAGELELLHDTWPPSPAAINSSALMAMPPAKVRQLEYATPAEVIKSVHPHDDHIDCAAALRKVVS